MSFSNLSDPRISNYELKELGKPANRDIGPGTYSVPDKWENKGRQDIKAHKASFGTSSSKSRPRDTFLSRDFSPIYNKDERQKMLKKYGSKKKVSSTTEEIESSPALEDDNVLSRYLMSQPVSISATLRKNREADLKARQVYRERFREESEKRYTQLLRECKASKGNSKKPRKKPCAEGGVDPKQLEATSKDYNEKKEYLEKKDEEETNDVVPGEANQDTTEADEAKEEENRDLGNVNENLDSVVSKEEKLSKDVEGEDRVSIIRDSDKEAPDELKEEEHIELGVANEADHKDEEVDDKNGSSSFKETSESEDKRSYDKEEDGNSCSHPESKGEVSEASEVASIAETAEAKPETKSAEVFESKVDSLSPPSIIEDNPQMVDSNPASPVEGKVTSLESTDDNVPLSIPAESKRTPPSAAASGELKEL